MSGEEGDEEIGDGDDMNNRKQRGQGISTRSSENEVMNWCHMCEIEIENEAVHCSECNVCIEKYDHHCVFFSKCIGGGNLWCFYATIGGIIFNFVNIAMLILVTAIMGPFTTSESMTNSFDIMMNASMEATQASQQNV